MDQDPAIDFAYFSVIAAGLRDRTLDERKAILSGLGLGARWEGIRAQWALTLLDDIARADWRRAKQYQEACEHDRERRGEGDDAFGAVSTGDPVTPEMVPTPGRPVTLVGLPVEPLPVVSITKEKGPPSVTMESVPAMHFEEGADEVAVHAPQTLDLASQLDGEPITLIPEQPRRLTSRSASDPALEATRRAMRWSVEHYAAFSASLALRPDDQAAVAAEFDLPIEISDAVVKAWQRRLDKDEALRASYLVHYEASLQHRKPTS